MKRLWFGPHPQVKYHVTSTSFTCYVKMIASYLDDIVVDDYEN